MPASYPASTKVFTRRPVDRVDTVYAADILELQDEIVAIEDVLGYDPHTSPVFPGTTSISQRLDTAEGDFNNRLIGLEQGERSAQVSLIRNAALLQSSGVTWSTLAWTTVVTDSEVNDFDGTTLYDAAAGRLYSVAPDRTKWAVSASISWQGGSTTGRRGLRLIGQEGRVYAQERRAPAGGADADVLSLSWVGVLPADPNYFLRLQVYQDSGGALDVLANSADTPTRVDFTHLPG